VPYKLNYVLRAVRINVHCGFIEKNVVQFCEDLVWLTHFENFNWKMVKKVPYKLNYVLRAVRTNVHCGFIEKNVVQFCVDLIWL
jgi:hypothetical protein